MPTARIEDFFARVDAELARLDPDAQFAFLDRLTEQWIERFQTFQDRIDRGAPTPPGTSAWDYQETIAGLDQRTARVPAHA